jgi:sRNA-binding carbon storage regulator CsrA
MLVLTRYTGQSIIFRPADPEQATRLTLAQVTGEIFIGISAVTSRRTRPDLEFQFPDDLLVLETVFDGCESYFDLVIRENVDPTAITLAQLFERGPIRVTVSDRRRRALQLSIEAHRAITVLRAELQGTPPRQSRQAPRQATPQRLIA